LGAVFDQHVEAGGVEKLLTGGLSICAEVDTCGHHRAAAKVDHHAGFVARALLRLRCSCRDEHERRGEKQYSPSEPARDSGEQ
jgi:hypothetical protein